MNKSKNIVMFYETDENNTAWTRLCLRQADKILLLGHSADIGKLGGIEQYLFYSLEKSYRVSIELILMHAQSKGLPTKTTEWTLERPVKVYHIKKDSEHDLKRIVRLLLGRRVGLVWGRWS
jgi:NTE family protein